MEAERCAAERKVIYNTTSAVLPLELYEHKHNPRYRPRPGPTVRRSPLEAPINLQLADLSEHKPYDAQYYCGPKVTVTSRNKCYVVVVALWECSF
jgi:hypothetical protein